MEKNKYKGMYYIKCTAEANNSPPQIYWKVGYAPEILGKFTCTQIILY